MYLYIHSNYTLANHHHVNSHKIIYLYVKYSLSRIVYLLLGSWNYKHLIVPTKPCFFRQILLFIFPYFLVGIHLILNIVNGIFIKLLFYYRNKIFPRNSVVILTEYVSLYHNYTFFGQHMAYPTLNKCEIGHCQSFLRKSQGQMGN